MGILNICKVTPLIAPLNKDGTKGTVVAVPYYFQGSSVYADSTFATAVGIELIPADKWDGSHPLVPVAALIQSGILTRISVVVQNASKKRRRYDLAVNQEKLSGLIDGGPTERLNGKNYKLLSRTGTTVDMGKVIRIGGKTTQYNP